MEKTITQKERNIIKSKIQEEVSELSLIHPLLAIEIGTGGGKTLCVLKSIKKSKSNLKWIVVVPEIQQIENFKNEMIEFGYDYLLSTKIEAIICYASLKNYENTVYNMAYNECHSINDNRLDIALTIKSDQVIFDSATITYDVRQRLEQFGDIYTYTISLKEGIELGLLPKPEIHIIDVDINQIQEKFEYTKFKKVYKNISAVEYYEYLTDQIKYWRDRYNRERQSYMENQSLQYASKRKRFIGSLKTIVTKQLINELKSENKRFITFASSIGQMEDLADKSLIVNSKISSKINTQTIKRFNSLETNEIYAVGQLISGMNLYKIDAGIICQLDSGNTENKDEINGIKILQCIGRILRSDKPIIYILNIPNTVDEKYLKNAIKAIGEEFIIKN